MKRKTLLALVFLFILFCSCVQRQATLAPGTRPFVQTEPEKVVEMTFAKADPTTGDEWIAVLKHDLSDRMQQWKIVSGPSEQPSGAMRDFLADEVYLNHLLDSLRSVRVTGPAPGGLAESFGLGDHPRFAIKWRTSEQEFEIQVGNRLKDGSGFYVSFARGKTWVANGSAFEMLGLIDSFQFLRKRVWTSIHHDDVDEIEVSRGGRLALFAQREGDRWTNRKHEEVKKDLDAVLAKVIEARSQRILDQRADAAESGFQIKVLQRTGKSTVLKVGIRDGKVYGRNSDRPGVTFSLSPVVRMELLRLLD